MVERRMNGFDAYENAWDVMTKRLWSILGYNLVWLFFSLVLIVLIYSLTVVAFSSWLNFVLFGFFVFLTLSPLCELLPKNWTVC